VKAGNITVSFPYGEEYLRMELPGDRTEILYSKDMPKVARVGGKIIEMLEKPIETPPLAELVSKSRRILVIIPDITRACPTEILLKSLIPYIEENSGAEVSLLIATGLHRPVTEEEKRELVGEEIAKNYEILNHDARNEKQLARLNRKTSFGTPIVVNKLVLDSDLVIGVGLIEPHFFAGYSGGRKILLPGVAGADAVFNNHSFEMIKHPNSRYGILEGNPIHEDMVEFMKNTKLDFILNVILDKEKNISGIFAGDPVKAHLAGVRELEKYVKIPYARPADIVITTNGGYPLDRDIYQVVKSMDTAALVVKRGGVIIVAAECRDGLGGHKEFLEIIKGTSSPEEILARIKELEPIYDQWQAQILARVLEKAKIIVVTRNLDRKTLGDLQLMRAKTLEEALEIAYGIVGKKAEITAIPEGPYIIPMQR